MNIDQFASFSKLSIGDKRKHLYAIYVIEDLIAKGLITIVNDDFNIYNLDIGYMETFDSKIIESKVYGKKQTKTTKKNELDNAAHSDSDESSNTSSTVSETPSKKVRKPRAKKTDEVVVDENGVVLATPSKTPRKPRAKKTELVPIVEEQQQIAEEPVQPVEQVVVPETPSKKARKPRAKKTDEVVVDEDAVPETPSKKARKPRAKKDSELPIIPEEILSTPVQPVELPAEKTIADKIVDCIPDTKGKKKTAEKQPKTPSKKNNKTAEPIVAEPIADRPVTPELVEENMTTMTVVEAETEDGVTVTYLLEEKTGKIYNADDHKLKTQIGRLSEEGELELFEN